MTGRPPQNLTGKRFGQLVAVEMLDKRNWYGRWWRLRCDCGGYTEAQPYTLNRGSVTSCGCTHHDGHIKALTTHGMTDSQEYRSWHSMKDRCCNPNLKDYPRYGGRGISICGRWINSFQNFYSDMGPRPGGTTLDRINVDGDYTRDNCRWATAKEQANNRRRPRRTESGVQLIKGSGRWRARHHSHHIGMYDTREEAEAAKKTYVRELQIIEATE